MLTSQQYRVKKTKNTKKNHEFVTLFQYLFNKTRNAVQKKEQTLNFIKTENRKINSEY